jgi:MtN3 and saliva related transmembrane protein
LSTLELLGFIAACFTTGAFLPQAIKIARTKQVEGLSVIMYLMSNTGIILWMVYGYYIGSDPLLFSNMVTFTFTSFILYNIIKQKMIKE